ncbi:hypothetical protein ACHAPK_003954 [Fusarium culmorum]
MADKKIAHENDKSPALINPTGGSIAAAWADNFVPILSGNVYKIKMPEEEVKNFIDMLEIQWHLTAIGAMAGAADYLDLLPMFDDFDPMGQIAPNILEGEYNKAAPVLSLDVGITMVTLQDPDEDYELNQGTPVYQGEHDDAESANLCQVCNPIPRRESQVQTNKCGSRDAFYCNFMATSIGQVAHIIPFAWNKTEVAPSST